MTNVKIIVMLLTMTRSTVENSEMEMKDSTCMVLLLRAWRYTQGQCQNGFVYLDVPYAVIVLDNLYTSAYNICNNIQVRKMNENLV